MLDFSLNMLDFVFKMTDFFLKMMNFGRPPAGPGAVAAAAGAAAATAVFRFEFCYLKKTTGLPLEMRDSSPENEGFSLASQSTSVIKMMNFALKMMNFVWMQSTSRIRCVRPTTM